MREGTQGCPLVNPLNNVVLKINDVNHFIKKLKKNNFVKPLKTFFFVYDVNYFITFKKKSLRKRLKDLSLICIIHTYVCSMYVRMYVVCMYACMYVYRLETCIAVSFNQTELSVATRASMWCSGVST
jgi:hypothetical protein